MDLPDRWSVNQVGKWHEGKEDVQLGVGLQRWRRVEFRGNSSEAARAVRKGMETRGAGMGKTMAQARM